MRETTSQRRDLIKMIGAAAFGLSSFGSAAANDEPSTRDNAEHGSGGGAEYPVKHNTSDSFTGPDYHGHETRLELGSGLVEYEPRFVTSLDKWELDFVVSGETDVRHTSDDSTADWMWQQEHRIHDYNSSTDLYSRDDPDWIGATGNDSDGYDYVSDEEVADGIGEAISALNPVPGTDYVVEDFASKMANWWLSQDNDTHLKRVWDFSEHTSTHNSGTHLLFRIEADGGYSDSFTAENTAISTRENVTITKFNISFSTGTEPSSSSTAEMNDMGLKRVTPEMVADARPTDLSISSHAAQEISRRNETMYVATNTDFTSVTAISGGDRQKAIQRLIDE